MSEPQNAALIALSAVIADAADLLARPAEDVIVSELTATTWPDGCLGLPGPGEVCTEAVVPGFRVRLSGGVVYRTDGHGGIRREQGKPATDTEVWVRLTQVGGIGGWSSEFLATEGEDLDPAAAARIRVFLAETDFFDYPDEVGNGSRIADLYSYALTLGIGRRNHTVRTYDGSGPLDKPELGPILALVKSLAPVPGPDTRVQVD